MNGSINIYFNYSTANIINPGLILSLYSSHLYITCKLVTRQAMYIHIITHNRNFKLLSLILLFLSYNERVKINK